jgi:hypothetical protein
MRSSGPRIGVLALTIVALLAACGGDGPTDVADTERPTVTATTPADEATNVARASAISATFSEAIDPATATTTSFVVVANGTTAVTGTVSTSGSTVTFTPAADAPFGTYLARFTTAIEDLSGNNLVPFQWNFSTVANPPPTVTAMSPAAGATNVPLNTTISATFSEPIAPASVNATTFRVTPAVGADVAGTFTVNGAVVTFTPTNNISPSGTYTVRLSTGITDAFGMPMSQQVTWSFTTPVNQAPTVNAGPTLNVGLNVQITLPGTGSDPEGEALTWRWTQILGPDVTGGAGFRTGQTPTVTGPPIVTTVRFSLTATDATGAVSAPSLLQINVMEDPTRAIFVTPLGDDANNGATRTAPVRTLGVAIAKAVAAGGGTDVYAGTGTYTESVNLQTGVSIYGGFESTTWIRNTQMSPTTIEGGSNMIAMSATNVNGVTIDGLRITTPLTGAAPGQSMYGVLLIQSSNIRIVNNRITAGSAGPGLNGQVGAPGIRGLTGNDGGNATCVGPTGIGGGAGASGQPDAPIGGSQSGFAGGTGGNGGNAGSAGQSGTAGNGTGAGSLGVGGSFPGNSGQDGGNGALGSVGQNGSAGAQLGTLSVGGYTPPDATGGTSGASGGSGGGAGAGAGTATGAGGGGGGGGASGGGGNFGQGGRGGGGSFAIAVVSSTGIVLGENVLATGTGGVGGAGGLGGAGGPAGLGGTGGSGCDGGGTGGQGGAGGGGGGGGHGGGGSGGPSIGIFEDAASVITIVALNSHQIGFGGGGGASQGAPGAAGISAQARKLP